MTTRADHDGAADRVGDRLAILDLWARYCLSLDRDDLEMHLGVFADDVVYQVYGREMSGVDGVRKMLSGAPHGLHLGGQVVIDFVDDMTANTTHNLYFVPLEGEARRATYTGELCKTATGWKIARWRCQFITKSGLQDRP